QSSSPLPRIRRALVLRTACGEGGTEVSPGWNGEAEPSVGPLLILRAAFNRRHSFARPSALASSFHDYDHFPPSVSCFQMPHRLRDLTQRVAPVDHGCYLSSLHKLAKRSQVRLVRFCQEERNQCLAHEPGQYHRRERTRQSADHPPSALCSDRNIGSLRVQDAPAR